MKNLKYLVSGESINEYKDFLYEPNVNFFRNGTLEFLHTSKANEGKYMCEAKNGVGLGLSKVIQLKINGKSFVIILPYNVFVFCIKYSDESQVLINKCN